MIDTPIGHILADVKRIDDFVASYESSAREFVEFDKVQDYHHDFDNFAEIMKYAMSCGFIDDRA